MTDNPVVLIVIIVAVVAAIAGGQPHRDARGPRG